jgi:hypothetical protein
MEYDSKCDTSNHNDDWSYFKITSLKQYLRNISGKQEITELQKTAYIWHWTQYEKR